MLRGHRSMALFLVAFLAAAAAPLPSMANEGGRRASSNRRRPELTGRADQDFLTVCCRGGAARKRPARHATGLSSGPRAKALPRSGCAVRHGLSSFPAKAHLAARHLTERPVSRPTR